MWRDSLLTFYPLINAVLIFSSPCQAASLASSHQWKGCQHCPARVIFLQTQESPGGSDGTEEGEGQTHAPAQTAGKSTICNYKAICLAFFAHTSGQIPALLMKARLQIKTCCRSWSFTLDSNLLQIMIAYIKDTSWEDFRVLKVGTDRC